MSAPESRKERERGSCRLGRKRLIAFQLTSIIALLSLTQWIASCSWIARRSLPEGCHATRLEDCGGYGWPIVDMTVGAGFLLGGWAMTIVQSSRDCGGDGICEGVTRFGMAVGLSMIALGLLWGISAGTGFSDERKCRKEADKFKMMVRSSVSLEYRGKAMVEAFLKSRGAK